MNFQLRHCGLSSSRTLNLHSIFLTLIQLVRDHLANTSLIFWTLSIQIILNRWWSMLTSKECLQMQKILRVRALLFLNSGKKSLNLCLTFLVSTICFVIWPQYFFWIVEKSGKTLYLLKEGSKKINGSKKRKKVDILGTFSEYKDSKKKVL